MLPDEQVEVNAHLDAAHQKLLEMIAEGESGGIDLHTIYQIASVQIDLQSAAISLLRCQLRTSIQTMMNPGTPNSDKEQKKLIEQYQMWLKITW